MSKKIAGNPAHDATILSVPIELEGQSYDLAFTWGSLSALASELRRRAIKMSVVAAFADFSAVDADSLHLFLYAALIPSVPDITIERAASLITVRNYWIVLNKLADAYVLALSDPKDRPKNEQAEEASE
jgi:hypothetical protein